MEGRRYSEGLLGDSAPEITFARPSINNPQDAMRKRRRENYLVPSSVNLSSTSVAEDCFVKRHNSRKLQGFLLNYAYILVTSKVLSGEV